MDRFGNESAAVQVSESAAATTRQRLKLDADGHVRGLVVRPVVKSKNNKKSGRKRKK